MRHCGIDQNAPSQPSSPSQPQPQLQLQSQPQPQLQLGTTLAPYHSQPRQQPQSQPQPQPQQVRSSPAQRMADEGVPSAQAQQHRQGRERLLRAEQRGLPVLEVARVADAQATTLHSLQTTCEATALGGEHPWEDPAGGRTGTGTGAGYSSGPRRRQPSCG